MTTNRLRPIYWSGGGSGGGTTATTTAAEAGAGAGAGAGASASAATAGAEAGAGAGAGGMAPKRSSPLISRSAELNGMGGGGNAIQPANDTSKGLN